MKWKQYKDLNYEVSDEGFIRNRTTKKVLTPVIKKQGYMEVRLSTNGNIRCYRVHKLVISTWESEPKLGMHIDHINGIKTDNRLVNLREVTPEENQKNIVNRRRGTQINTNKLSERQVMEIRRAKSKGVRTKDLQQQYGISKTTILRIASGKLWKHLPILSTDKSFWGDPHKTGGMSGRELTKKFGDEYFSKIASGNKLYVYCEKCGQKIK